ncbi:hypothetical protein D3C72_2327810 [compost metagenome]
MGASYPIFGTPALEGLDGTALQQLQRHPDSRLRAAIEFSGDFGPAGGHYVLPGVLMSPNDAMQLGLGLGLRLAGDQKPLFLQSQVQISF